MIASLAQALTCIDCARELPDPAHRTLDEGATPLLDWPGRARALGVRALTRKFEGTNPTGTVKDRSSTTAVAAALQCGSSCCT